MRLSRQVTLKPFFRKWSQRWEPMNPAPPAINSFFLNFSMDPIFIAVVAPIFPSNWANGHLYRKAQDFGRANQSARQGHPNEYHVPHSGNILDLLYSEYRQYHLKCKN